MMEVLLGYILGAVLTIVAVFATAYPLDKSHWHCTRYDSAADQCVEYQRKEQGK